MEGFEPTKPQRSDVPEAMNMPPDQASELFYRRHLGSSYTSKHQGFPSHRESRESLADLHRYLDSKEVENNMRLVLEELERQGSAEQNTTFLEPDIKRPAEEVNRPIQQDLPIF